MANSAATEFVVSVQQGMNVDICWQRIEQAERQIAGYEQKYGTTYETFNRRVATDENFLTATHRDHPTWEADAIEWDYRLEELQTWQNRLEKILRELLPSLV